MLPKIKSANEVLEIERDEGRLEERNIENVREGGQGGRYIEMNLGLGVLEEKTGDGAQEQEDNEDDSVEVKERGERLGEGDVLGDMMGKKRNREKRRRAVGIEEVKS